MLLHAEEAKQSSQAKRNPVSENGQSSYDLAMLWHLSDHSVTRWYLRARLGHHKETMGLRTILKKMKRKEKEVRVLILYPFGRQPVLYSYRRSAIGALVG